MPDTELVFGTDGEALRWPDGELMVKSDFDQLDKIKGPNGEPIYDSDFDTMDKKRRDHMGCWIKRVVWVGDQVDAIDFGVDLDRLS